MFFLAFNVCKNQKRKQLYNNSMKKEQGWEHFSLTNNSQNDTYFTTVNKIVIIEQLSLIVSICSIQGQEHMQQTQQYNGGEQQNPMMHQMNDKNKDKGQHAKIKVILTQYTITGSKKLFDNIHQIQLNNLSENVEIVQAVNIAIMDSEDAEYAILIVLDEKSLYNRQRNLIGLKIEQNQNERFALKEIGRWKMLYPKIYLKNSKCSKQTGKKCQQINNQCYAMVWGVCSEEYPLVSNEQIFYGCLRLGTNVQNKDRYSLMKHKQMQYKWDLYWQWRVEMHKAIIKIYEQGEQTAKLICNISQNSFHPMPTLDGLLILYECDQPLEMVSDQSPDSGSSSAELQFIKVSDILFFIKVIHTHNSVYIQSMRKIDTQHCMTFLQAFPSSSSVWVRYPQNHFNQTLLLLSLPSLQPIHIMKRTVGYNVSTAFQPFFIHNKSNILTLCKNSLQIRCPQQVIFNCYFKQLMLEPKFYKITSKQPEQKTYLIAHGNDQILVIDPHQMVSIKMSEYDENEEYSGGYMAM